MVTDAPPAENDIALVIDQGGHSSRVIAYDRNGEAVATVQKAVAEQHPQQEQVEQDPRELLDSIRACLHEISDAPELRSRPIVAAGMATQRSSLCCWDRQTGQALSPVISWQDRRNGDWLHTRAAGQQPQIHQRTGLLVSPHYGAGKIHWCLEHLPNVRDARSRGELCVAPLAGFLMNQLLEEKPFVVDPANASRTLLWNIHTGQWDAQLLELFDIPADILPQCTDTRAEFGKLPVGGHQVPLTICNGDQSAALFAAGEPSPDTAYINIGTGAFVSLFCEHLPEDPQGLLASVVFRQGQHIRQVLEGTVNGAGSALDWITLGHGLTVAAALEQLPVWMEQEPQPPLFLNGISGLGAPLWRADFQSEFIGTGNIPAQIVAVVESIIFLIQLILERMQSLRQSVQQIRISGGIARLDPLCQRLADLSGLPVTRASDAEATGRGTAWLVFEEPATWPQPHPLHQFAPVKSDLLRRRYTNWREVLLQRCGIEPGEGNLF